MKLAHQEGVQDLTLTVLWYEQENLLKENYSASNPILFNYFLL